MGDLTKITLFVLLALTTANAELYDFDGNLIGDDIQPLNTNATPPASPPAGAGQSGGASQEPSILGLITQTIGVNVSQGEDPLAVFRDSYPLPHGYSQPLDEYDYIIVGAGSAGSALAARLTEDPKNMVLVLEAGQPEFLLTDIPILTAQWPVSDYAWQYHAEKQPGICTGTEGDVCYWPRGKGVGGTSIINFMIYTRGRPQDWDRIAADGNYGWSYNDVLKYYMKSEKADLKLLPKNPPNHGRNGPLNVEHISLRTGLVESFLEAGRINGYPTVDYNSPDDFGFGYVQANTHHGHRVSAAKAYLHPHKHRPNLHILPSSTVTKVNIDPSSMRAYGVNYTRNGNNYVVRCRKEVILSAGPIASPQLLMLSGVGPKKHLKSLGIPVIKDLPVGRTMYDHVTFPGIAFKINATNAGILLSDVVTPKNLIEWIFYGEGLMSSIGTIEGIGYIKTSESDDPEMVPDIELISLAGSLALDSGAYLRKAWKIKDSTYNDGFSSLNGLDTWMAVPMLLHPKSKGYLELRDANPFSQPKLVANYFTDPKDLATMKAAVKFIIMLGESKAFKKYGMSLHLPKYEQCQTQVPGSDDYWECALKTLLISLHHQIATCRMGPPGDPLAVVDPELKVYGVKGLRVVDSGVIPRPTSAHTNAPAIMIGEKAADMIKRGSWC